MGSAQVEVNKSEDCGKLSSLRGKGPTDDTTQMGHYQVPLNQLV